jgi:hypothetical protein
MKLENQKPQKLPGFNALKFWSMTLPLILTVGLLGFLGQMLDKILKFNFPVFTLLGIFAGLVGTVYQLLRALKNK